MDELLIVQKDSNICLESSPAKTGIITEYLNP
jgi:hypothetical protein